jgi:hypothetical protein
MADQDQPRVRRPVGFMVIHLGHVGAFHLGRRPSGFLADQPLYRLGQSRHHDELQAQLLPQPQ